MSTQTILGRIRRKPARPALSVGWVAGLLAVLAARADFQGATHLMPFDEDTIGYSKTVATDPIAQLQKRLDAGAAKLAYDAEFGYLPAVLEALKVPQASQMLVFSKTSFQRERIAPRTPRAVFFGDDVYVGYVVGSPLLEFSAVDPKLGGVFYTLEQTAGKRPKFVRTDNCLECHASAKSMGVPGHLVRSFETDENGQVDLNTGTSQVSHRTPLAERWGGWYVTGLHGSQPHRGNLIGKAAFARQVDEPNHLGNLTNLSRFFNTGDYLQPTSDIVALMVMEHQSHMHNFITRLHYESTLALRSYGHLRYLNSITDAFIKYLLFVEETPLKAPLVGTPAFQRAFAASRKPDPRGRSLRDFDLQTRLFKHPCSYLIYSDAFDALPREMKDKIYRRLWEVLTGRDDGEAWQSLTADQRQTVLEILVATKTDLPDYWKKK